MATSYTLAGQVNDTAFFQGTAGAERAGGERATVTDAITFNDAGGSEPDIAGFLYGLGSVANGAPITLLLAHATDPLAGAGDASYYPPTFTVASKKIKYLILKNTTVAGGGTLKVERATGNGCPVFDADGDSLTLRPQGHVKLYQYDGLAALTTTTNDGLTLTASSGTVTFALLVVYGA